VGGFAVKPILPFLPKARMKSAFCAGSRQVFGLAGWRLSYWPLLPNFAERISASIRRSFLLTAAGQFRIHTGFP